MMTTIRHYRCNLCRDNIKPTDGFARDGLGVHFLSNSPKDNHAWLTLKTVTECETHICLACARAVHDELRKITPAGETP